MSSRSAFLGLAALLLCAGSAAAQEALSLERLEAIALERSPILRLATLGAEVAEAEYLRARWAWVPRLNLKGGGGYMPGQRVNDDGRLTSDFAEIGYSFKVEGDLAMPIYTFGKLALLDDMGHAGRDLAAAKAAALEHEVLYQVRRLHDTMLFLEELSRIAVEGRKYYDKAADRLDALEEDDDEDYDQVDHFKLRVYEADIVRMELEAARNLLRAREALAAVCGLPTDGAIALAASALEPVRPEADAAEGAGAARADRAPEIRALDVEARLGELAAEIEARKWWPDLLLVGFGKYQVAEPVHNFYSGEPVYDPYNTLYGGAALGLRWSLDVIGRLGASRKARAMAGIKRTKHDLYREKLSLEIADLARRLADQRTLLDATRRAERAARSWLVDRSNLYDSGFVEVKEVLEALRAFYERKMQRLQANLDLNLAWYELRKVGALEGE
jgi:outer membrane protein TolC